MRFSILNVIFLSLFFHTSYSSESSFISRPIHPKLEEDVLLACTLTAPDGYQFSGTVPDLTTSNIDHQFNFDEIQSELGDSRYHGWTIRDSSSSYLQGFIFISSLQESDLSINFTCFQYVENVREISASLILANFVQNTFTPPPAVVTDSIDSTSDSIKTAETTQSNGIVPSTGCPVCGPGSSIWEKTTLIISVTIASLLICQNLFKVRTKKNILKIYRTLRKNISTCKSSEPPTGLKSVTKSVNRPQDSSIEIDPNSSGSTSPETLQESDQ